MSKKNEGANIGKIIAITLAVVAGACAVIWFAIKLYRKYCLLECNYDDELDELDAQECDECEVMVEEPETAEPAQA